MLPAGIIILLLISLAEIPPLTVEQRTALDTAFDGRDHREEAFAALVDHVRTWSPGPIDAAVRLDPDPGTMIDDPGGSRGDLCRIAGRLDQRSPLPRPFGGVEAWFIRSDAGTPLLVFVVGPDGDLGAGLAEGQHVAIYARFYKRVGAVARDGRVRQYAAFVGAFPRIVPRSALALSPGGVLWLAGLLVAALAAVLILAILMSRRWRTGPSRRPNAPSRSDSPARLDEGGPLPDDPAEALAELRRRAQGGDSCTPST